MKKILIVDDQQEYREVFSAILGEEGKYNIQTADGGNACLTMLSTFYPDIILMDIAMPDLDGITTVKELRKKFPKIPVIFITSFSESRCGDDVRSVAPSRLLQKPVSEAVLKKEVENFLDNPLLCDNARALVKKTKEKKESKRIDNANMFTVVDSLRHELRSPLNNIIGFTQLLSGRTTNFDEKQKKYLKNIAQSTKVLSLLIEEIVLFSKLSSGEHELTLAKFPIDYLLSQYLSYYIEELVQKGVDVENKLQKWNVKILIDEALIKHALEIFFSYLQRIAKGKIVFSTEKKEKCLDISVFFSEAKFSLPSYDTIKQGIGKIFESNDKRGALQLLVMYRIFEMQGMSFFWEQLENNQGCFHFSFKIAL